MSAENDIELWIVLDRWERVREEWSLTSQEETKLLSGAPIEGPVERVPSWGATRLEHRMRLLIRLSGVLKSLFKDEEQVVHWLRAPLASLGQRNPLEAMSSSMEWIRAFERNARDFVS